MKLEPLEGLQGEGGLPVLEFLPDGTTQDATLGISNNRGDKQILVVTGATSRVEILDDQEER